METVDLVVPVKSLTAAKSRLRGAADHGVGDPKAHARLALALVLDTVTAALAARRVRRLLVITSDPTVSLEVAAVGVPVAPDTPGGGLNPALERGAHLLRQNDPCAAVGALQADLPALRPAELDAAIERAAAIFAAGPAPRAYCADAAGEGTTLLLCAPGSALQPCFGTDSAAHHERSGAYPLQGDWPGLRRDVDTGEDLRRAADLGVGPRTREVLAPCPHP
ncbi:2-phospho-L-lactate guanylyltransferase [Pseudonocardia bannensis]|uniref:Phosphoenolpyruvate guanylyltransferase n=1 Tax=Pseudonocardia bannensis TaxID=630973 RepID=A0A848DR10_9PSEU|nr:2-phospho-L-lactate guanylyltransferase [Pseudonocardia bannensis]